MRSAVLAFLLPAFAAAQLYGPAPGPAGGSTTTSSSASNAAPSAPANSAGFVNVDVAPGGNIMYNPSNFNASNGTVVTFFFPTSDLTHSVTQSSFADPCTALAANSSTGAAAGFDSGLQQAVQFSITITDDTTPIWFHCKQVQHCGLGMVGAINAPTSGNTFSAFQSAAMAIGANEVTETDNGPVLAGVGASASASPANTAAGSGSTGTSGGSSSSASHVVASGVLALAGAALSMIVFA